jgi:uncharacterized tellurite resistance protein B-like protein
MKKINLNRDFKDFAGTALAGEKISDAIARHLYLGRGISADNGDEKYAAWKLCTKIISADGTLDVSPEEAELIKKVAAAALTPGAYGQVIDLING